jgi:hypothetical protein
VTTSAWVALLITVAFGGGGLGTLVNIVVNRRKLKADTAKAKADTDASIAAAANAIAGAGAQLVGALLGPAQSQIEHLQTALSKATEELAQLRVTVAELSAELERRPKPEENP